MTRVDVSRRGFLGQFFSAGALVVGVPLLVKDASAAAAATSSGDPAWSPSVYLGLERDGSVIIVAHRSEMGTGARTCLPMIVADELEADWKRVKIVQAIGDKKYGSQNTDGSCSVRDFYDAMRQAGAAARTMLEQSAAATWNVPAAECKAQDHFVVHTPTGRKAPYGDLVAAASTLTAPKKEQLKYKTPDQFRYIGKDVSAVDLDDLVAGKAIFGTDVQRPGMIYASIERPPVMGGTLKSVNDAEAKKVKGVQDVVEVEFAKPPYAFKPLGGIAVLANNSWAALQGRKKLDIQWEAGEHGSYESEAFKKAMLETAKKPGRVARDFGNVDEAFASASKTHEASYYTPMLSHAPMEPPAAVVEFKDGKVEAWTCTQNPQAVQDTVAAAVGVNKNDVICHVTLLGGGFGRKSKPDYVAEAAILSKKTGKPVKLVWSREDDIHFDYFHSEAGMYMKAALDEKGRPTAWLQRSVFPPIAMQGNPNEEYGGFQLGMGWTDTPYRIPNFRVENGPAHAHVRIGWLRSVANIYHAFGVQTFTDELAALANRDRVEYLLDLIGDPRVIELDKEGVKQGGRTNPKFPLDTGRLRNVIQLAAEQSGWGKQKSGGGRGWGIAAHRSFLTYVASVVEVEVNKGEVRIVKVNTVVDPGRIINPDRVKAQFEGAAVFGTSIALMGEITAAGGKIVQSNFHNYPVARINEAPMETHIHVVASDAAPAGVGEPGVPPMAPAICNAVFAATGKRVRELPLKKQKLA